MLKPLLLGAAIILAVPALAQTGTANPDMNKPGTAASNSGMTTDAQGQTTGSSTGTAGSTGDSGWGTSASTSSTSSSTGTGTGAGTSSSWNNGSSAFTGRGGPDTGGKTYPTCSRTLRDNCMQRGGRGHHMARRRGR
jgi:hypothetical protein